MKRVEQHHELMIKIQKHRSVFINSASPRIELVRLEETSAATAASNSTENRSQPRQQLDTESIDSDAIDENDNTNDEINESDYINNSSDDENISVHMSGHTAHS